jgi:DnaJ like chaperone protein
MQFLILILALLYVLSPWDLFPTPIDDLIILAFLWWYVFVYGKRGLRGRTAFQNRQEFSRGSDDSGFSKGEGTRKGPGSQGGTADRDPHRILGVGPNASREEIKKAYRRLANQYHPDKVSHLGREFRDLAERRFKDIQEAYQKLMS